jgi:hypothetical protein
MKLQASEPSGPESLQSQTRPWPKKRLSISRLGVVHRRLHQGAGALRNVYAQGLFSLAPLPLVGNEQGRSALRPGKGGGSVVRRPGLLDDARAVVQVEGR